jgi:DNA-binding transcriptional LysR family regulator
MSLRALRHFVVVAEELHMHRAAERLHIAQPALSQQIKQLEQRLGVVLFSRANRRLTLTAAGEAFLHKTRLALEMADQAVLDAQRTARGEQGGCIWGMSPARCTTVNCRGSCAAARRLAGD